MNSSISRNIDEIRELAALAQSDKASSSSKLKNISKNRNQNKDKSLRSAERKAMIAALEHDPMESDDMAFIKGITMDRLPMAPGETFLLAPSYSTSVDVGSGTLTESLDALNLMHIYPVRDVG